MRRQSAGQIRGMGTRQGATPPPRNEGVGAVVAEPARQRPEARLQRLRENRMPD
jgi:hypothetical protein